MYEIALSVAACLRAGTRVDVAWVVGDDGSGDRDLGAALAVTPGGGRVGSLGGPLDDQLVDLSSQGSTGRVVELRSLGHDGVTRCVLVPAGTLGGDLWERLRRQEPVGVTLHLSDGRIAGATTFGADTAAGADDDVARLFNRRVSGSLVAAGTVTSVFWPVPRLLIVGGGPMAAALHDAAALLGWRVDVAADARTATGTIAAMAALDKVVVVGHDLELTGTALEAALAGDVGYIGALGPRRLQESRADWLAHRGVTDLERVHGPAGLDIGAATPPEIAISVLAEAIAAAKG